MNTGFYLSKKEVKGFNVMIVEINVFDQLVKSEMRGYDKICKIETVQGNDYDCLSKQQTQDVNSKPM